MVRPDRATAEAHFLFCRRCAARIGDVSGRLATQPRKRSRAPKLDMATKVGLPGYSLAVGPANTIYGKGIGGSGDPARECAITAPATDDARHWDGFGTALKPAYEPIILARKPLDGTLVDNVRKWGVGALAIDACRIEYLNEDDKAAAAEAAAQRLARPSHGAGVGDFGLHGENAAGSLTTFLAKQDLGRWPANVCLDEIAAEMLDAQSGDRPGMSGGGKHRADYVGGMFGAIDSTHTARNDHGGASRFLYVAKASREERELGCDHLPFRTAGEAVKRKEGSAGLQSGRAGAGRTSGARNYGPCVKPVALTRWLATLIMPPPRRDGAPRRIVVPYAGTGSEMIGAILAGWDDVIGIEREPRPGIANAPDYLSILKARVHLAATNPRAFAPEASRKSEKPDARQLDLFGRRTG